MNWPVFCFTVAFTLIAMVLLSPAHPHDTPAGWAYNQWCCNDRDCRQLADGDVVERDGGWYIKSMDVHVPYNHPQIHISMDSHFHVCELPKGTVRCFYVTGGGV